MHIRFWNKSFCDKILSIHYTVLTRKDGGLSGAWTCWRRRPRHCYEMPAQDLWPGGSKPENVFRHNSTFFQVVALKKVPLKRLEDGISEATIREIKALQQLESQFVVK